MKQVVKQVALLGMALILLCAAGRLLLRNTHLDRIPVARTQGGDGEMRFIPGDGNRGIVTPGTPTATGDDVRVTLQATQPGEIWYEVRGPGGETLSTQHYRVDRFLTVYDYDTGGFTGDSLVMAALTVFWLGTALIMARAFRGARGPAFYAYDTIYYVGFGLFTLVTGVVMLNLTLNAFQAIGRESGGVVRVEGRQVSREVLQRRGLDTNGIWENYIRIRVVDNGCGMDKMTMEQIFTPFFTTRENGTGFGLAIAESMITSHRGYITVDSTPGKGSVFTVYLPAAKKADEERLHSAAASRGYEDGSHKILVVDDNVKILQELAGEFGKIGVNIKTCVNTGEAEEQLSRHHYHVLLIDNELSRAGGDNTGIDFAMSIREKYNGLLIIVMADKIRKEIVEARQEGIINAYLEKPVSVQELLETMQNTSSEIL